MPLHQAGMIFNIGLIFFNLINFFSYLCKQIGNGLVGTTPQPMHEWIARFGI